MKLQVNFNYGEWIKMKEKMIQNIIDKISKNSTVIIIAHRKSTLENSDKIIYLKDGKIDMIVNKENKSITQN